MTDVGKITVGVDIDGGDIGAKIGAAVRAKLAPVLAEIEKEINSTNSSLGALSPEGIQKVTAAADKAVSSTDKLTASTDKLTRSTSNIAAAEDRAEKQATKLNAAREIEKQKLDVVTQKQAEYTKEVDRWGGKAQFAVEQHAALTKAEADYRDAMDKTQAQLAKLGVAEQDVANARSVAAEKAANDIEASAARRVKAEIAAADAIERAAARESKAVEDGARRQSKARNDVINDAKKSASDLGEALKGVALPFGGLGTAAFAGIGELPAITTAAVIGVGALTGALVQLSGAAVALPGLIGGIGADFGVAELAIKPVASAIEAVSKAAGDGATKGQIKKAAADLKGLGDNGKAVVATIVGLQGAFTDLQQTDTETFFTGISDKIQNLADTQLPHVKQGVTTLAASLNQDLGTVLDKLAGPDTTSFLDRLVGNTDQANKNFQRAIGPIVDGVEHLIGASSDVLPRLANEFADLATNAANYLTKADQDGSLQRFINNGIDGVKDLGKTFGNLGGILGDISKSLGGTGGFLKTLDDGTKSLHDFLSSTQGQQDLKNFFVEGKKDLGDLVDVAKDAGPALKGIFDAAHDAIGVVLPIIHGLLDVVDAIPGGAETAIAAFLGFKAINAAAAVVSSFQVLRDLLTKGIPADVGVAETALAELKVEQEALGGPGGVLPGGGKTAAEIKAAEEAATAEKDAATTSKLIGGAETLAGGGGAALTVKSAASSVAEFGGLSALIAPATAVAALALGSVVGSNLLNDLSNKHPEAFNIDPDPNKRRPGRESQGGSPQLTATENRQSETARNGSIPVQALEDKDRLPGQLGGARAVGEIDTKTVDEANSKVLNLQKTLAALPAGHAIEITDNTPEVDEKLKALKLTVTTLPNGKVIVSADNTDALTKIAQVKTAFAGLQAVGSINIATAGPGSAHPGRALGGAIYGGVPGIDSVPIMAQMGEHVFDTTDVKLMGGQAGVYRFRQALNAGMVGRFADGGAVDGSLPDFSSGQGTGPLPGPPPDGTQLGGSDITALIAAVDRVRDAVLATGPNASASAVSAIPSGAIDASTTTAIGADGLPIKATKGSPLTADDKQANKNLTTALKPLSTEINDAIKKGLQTQPGTPLDDALIGARNNALTANQQIIADSGPAGSVVQEKFIEKNILGPLAAALNNTAKNDTPAKSLAKVGLSPDDPLVQLVLASRGGVVGGTTPVTAASLAAGGTGRGAGGKSIYATPPLPAGAAGFDFDGNPVDADGVPLSDTGTQALNRAKKAVGIPVAQLGIASTTNQNPTNDPVIAALLASGGQVAAQQAGNLIGAVNKATDFQLDPATLAAPNATVDQLTKEGNPLALAAAAGYNVPDFTRNGGTPASRNETNAGPGFDANGAIRSDTGQISDRTFTDAQAEQTAKLKQIEDVLNQVKDQLTDKVLEPVVESAVTAAFNNISDAATQKLGVQIGTAAAPIIANAVKSAVPASTGSGDSSTSNAGGIESSIAGLAGGFLGGGTTFFGTPPGVLGGTGMAGDGSIGGLFDEGGLWMPGTIGANLSGATERVLSPTQTAAFDAGQLGGWALQPLQQNMAAVEGQSANATVGADFFGASQVPILGGIINFLIQVLLQVIGVTIDARDTLDNASKEVRAFRGDFQKFDASGRLTNDTSGLLDRSNSSQQEVVDERLRILQQVIQGIVKYIIEQIITPITKAVTNAAISAGADAAGGAVGPVGGGIVSSLISSAGSAGADVGIQVASDASEAAISTAISAGFGIAKSNAPDLTTGVFGSDIFDNVLGAGTSSGGILSGATGILSNGSSGLLGSGDIGGIFTNLFSGFLGGGSSGGGGILSTLLNPLSLISGLFGGGSGGSGLGGIFGNLLGGGFLGTFTSLISSVLGGGLLGGGLFDEGGIANGIGLMPKATIKPERVLSPAQTQSFDRFVDAIATNNHSSTSSTVIHAPFTVSGGERGGRDARDKLLELMT